MKKNRKIYLIIGIVMCVYVLFTLINQQKTLNQYAENKKELLAKVDEQKEYKEELIQQKENVSSLSFIEQKAREKLNMYYPNEKVYIDQGM